VSATVAPERIWLCDTCGADMPRACRDPGPGCRVDAELVVWRLEQAGETLLAMRLARAGPEQWRSGMPEVVRTAIESYGWEIEPARPAVPSAAAVTAMDIAYRWLQLIPQHRMVLRRIVAMRSLVHPVNGRHISSWRRCGRLIGADHHAVQSWHRQGIATIVAALRGEL
jgi:hypothetical protein